MNASRNLAVKSAYQRHCCKPQKYLGDDAKHEVLILCRIFWIGSKGPWFQDIFLPNLNHVHISFQPVCCFIILPMYPDNNGVWIRLRMLWRNKENIKSHKYFFTATLDSVEPDKVLYEEVMTNDDNLESNLLTSSLLKIRNLYKFCYRLCYKLHMLSQRSV